ncbi:MAG: PQQ-dependent sugar dehydrogenase [Bryobacteraceae bacterium]|nr:PQQ-dependent sugar dehydrogenase [Bryobacteraceae bacterium]
MQRIILLTSFCIALGYAGTPPTGFSDTTIASGLSSPTAMAFAPDGRLFICQQAGAVRIVKNGSLLATPFVTLSVDSAGERGVLGIAFDPDFNTNQYVYLYYTGSGSPKFNRVSRFTANGDVVTPGSEVPVFRLPDLSTATNHNGGAMHFGPDGKLYVAVGENANPPLAQSMTSLMGKILRINADGTIPADNPFFSTTSGDLRAIWALGLRNPFTFGFQPETGRLFINDVGQNTWEEINDGVAAANYGWPATEGDFNASTFPFFQRPFYTYSHGGTPGGCAITGGTFYNPASPTFPAGYVGDYFFADYCGGWIYRLNLTTRTITQFVTGNSFTVDLKVGPDAALYYLQRGGGELHRVQVSNSAPVITQDPRAVTTPLGIAATFTVQATGANLTYQWQRNLTPIPNATGASYTLTNPQAADSGAMFRVVVTNSAGAATSNAALLTVSANQPPTTTILTPAAGSLFSAGDTITFTGSGNDPETGAIAAATLRWRVDYITGAATRPFVAEFTGAGGSFTVPLQTPYTLTDVYFLIYLTATDPQGFSTTVTRRVDPRVATHTLRTVPTGRQLTLDGTPVATPAAFGSVVSLQRILGAPSPQMAGGSRYAFSNWSDGGAATHTISSPISDTTYAANFTTEHLLTVNATAGGMAGGGGWFAAGATATLTATPAAGYGFTGWSGDFTGAGNSSNLVMDAPKTVTASFQPLPTSLLVSMTGRSAGASPSERRWTMLVRNAGTGAAVDVRLTGATLTPNPTGAAVAITTPLPVLVGDLAPGASAPLELLVQFPATTPPTRATLTLQFTTSRGAAGTITFNNLFR